MCTVSADLLTAVRGRQGAPDNRDVAGYLAVSPLGPAPMDQTRGGVVPLTA
jgi:hypothetical protein